MFGKDQTISLTADGLSGNFSFHTERSVRIRQYGRLIAPFAGKDGCGAPRSLGIVHPSAYRDPIQFPLQGFERLAGSNHLGIAGRVILDKPAPDLPCRI